MSGKRRRIRSRWSTHQAAVTHGAKASACRRLQRESNTVRRTADAHDHGVEMPPPGTGRPGLEQHGHPAPESFPRTTRRDQRQRHQCTVAGFSSDNPRSRWRRPAYRCHQAGTAVLAGQRHQSGLRAVVAGLPDRRSIRTAPDSASHDLTPRPPTATTASGSALVERVAARQGRAAGGVSGRWRRGALRHRQVHGAPGPRRSARAAPASRPFCSGALTSLVLIAAAGTRRRARRGQGRANQ
jgi:hypothetical protein